MQIIHSVPMMVFPTHIFLYYFFSIEQIIDSSLPPSVLLIPVPTPALPPLSRHLPHSSASRNTSFPSDHTYKRRFRKKHRLQQENWKRPSE